MARTLRKFDSAGKRTTGVGNVRRRAPDERETRSSPDQSILARRTPPGLDAGAVGLARETPLDRTARGTRRHALAGDLACNGDQFLKAAQGLGAVLFQTAELLRLDHQHAVATDTPVTPR